MNINPWEIKQYKAQLKLNKLEQQLFQVQDVEFNDNMIGAETYYYEEREKFLKKEIAKLIQGNDQMTDKELILKKAIDFKPPF